MPPPQTAPLWERDTPPHTLPPRRLRRLDTRTCDARSLGASSFLEHWLRTWYDDVYCPLPGSTMAQLVYAINQRTSPVLVNARPHTSNKEI